MRATLIERGPWRDTVLVQSIGVEDRAPLPYGKHFASHVLHTLRSPRVPFAVTPNRRGLFEIYVGKGRNIACTSSVGGGSRAYGGLNMRPAVGRGDEERPHRRGTVRGDRNRATAFGFSAAASSAPIT